MTSTSMSALNAIEESTTHNSIVTIDFDGAAYGELNRLSDDSVHANGITEFWGGYEDDQWRVHVLDITDEQVADLRTDAAEAGDLKQVDLCDRAINGDYPARTKCAQVLIDAAANDFDGAAEEIPEHFSSLTRPMI